MISTLLISPYLGAWVDLTPRLRAATTLTIVQVATYSEILQKPLGQPLAYPEILVNWSTPCFRVQPLLCLLSALVLASLKYIKYISTGH